MSSSHQASREVIDVCRALGACLEREQALREIHEDLQGAEDALLSQAKDKDRPKLRVRLMSTEQSARMRAELAVVLEELRLKVSAYSVFQGGGDMQISDSFTQDSRRMDEAWRDVEELEERVEALSSQIRGEFSPVRDLVGEEMAAEYLGILEQLGEREAALLSAHPCALGGLTGHPSSGHRWGISCPLLFVLLLTAVKAFAFPTAASCAGSSSSLCIWSLLLLVPLTVRCVKPFPSLGLNTLICPL